MITKFLEKILKSIYFLFKEIKLIFIYKKPNYIVVKIFFDKQVENVFTTKNISLAFEMAYFFRQKSEFLGELLTEYDVIKN